MWQLAIAAAVATIVGYYVVVACVREICAVVRLKLEQDFAINKMQTTRPPEALQPCPLCRGPGAFAWEREPNGIDTTYMARCRQCGCETWAYADDDDQSGDEIALQDWNLGIVYPKPEKEPDGETPAEKTETKDPA